MIPIIAGAAVGGYVVGRAIEAGIRKIVLVRRGRIAASSIPTAVEAFNAKYADVAAAQAAPAPPQAKPKNRASRRAEAKPKGTMEEQLREVLSKSGDIPAQA